jgi:large subunit ribosomal protein L23
MRTDVQEIIRRPILTERSNLLRERENKYTFEVHPDATKTDVKRAVEEIFGTRVTAVNLMNVTGKPRRVRVVRGKRRNWKKAVVTIEPGQTISFFEGV